MVASLMHWCHAHRGRLLAGAFVTLLFDVNGGLCFLAGLLFADEQAQRLVDKDRTKYYRGSKPLSLELEEVQK